MASAPVDTAPERVRIYMFADPSPLKQAEAMVRRMLLQVLRVPDQQRYQTMVSEAGYLFYADTQQLWSKGSAPNLDSDPSKAQKAAEDFLRSLKQAFTKTGTPRLPDALANMLIVPDVVPVQLSCVPRPDGKGYDHWLYRAQPQLDCSPRDPVKVAVIGTNIEVRIGANGQVVSFTSRWRPLSGESFADDGVAFTPTAAAAAATGFSPASPTTARSPTSTTSATAPTSPTGAGTASSNGQSSTVDEHMLIYLCEGDNTPQAYLSPFYLVNEHDNFTLASASKYSLLVAFEVKAGEQSESIITAHVDGGSGNYDFNWATLKLEDAWNEQGIQVRGSGSSGEEKTDDGSTSATSTITLDPGVYNVMVNVRDRATGAFRHYQHYVYGFPVLQQDNARGPLVA